MAGKLDGKIAVVTGSTRGIGRGIAIALGEMGATVYITGRSTGDGPLTIEGTAAAVEEAGGKAIPVRVDHGNDNEIEALFKKIEAEQGHLDILVNNVFKIPTPPVWGGGFWEHPVSVWDDQVGIGLRAHYVASWHAVPLLFKSDKPVILNVSSPGGLAFHFSSSYGAGKAGLDRLTADIAVELTEKKVPAMVLYPGGVATEFVLENAPGSDGVTIPEGMQTTLGVGRTAAALIASDNLMERTGTIQWCEDLSLEFDTKDEFGNHAAPYAGRADLIAAFAASKK